MEIDKEKQNIIKLGQNAFNRGRDNEVISKIFLNNHESLNEGGFIRDSLALTEGLPEPDDNGEIHVSGSYLIAGVTNIGTNEIILDGDTYFVSHNPGSDVLLYTGTGAAITGNGFGFTSFFTSYVSPAGRVFNLTGAADKMFSLFYCGISGQAQKSTIRTFGDLASLELCYILDGAGFEFGGVCGKAAFFVCPFKNMTGVEVTFLADYEGLIVFSNNFFKDNGGDYIEIIDTTNVRTRITNNDFPDPTATNFIGFSEVTPQFEVTANTNQIDSGTYLDAYFSGNTVVQTVGTEWEDIDVDYIVDYSQRIEWQPESKSFLYTGSDDALLKIVFDFYAESASNFEDFEFAIFKQNGTPFEPIDQIFPFQFRVSDATLFISIKDRVMIPSDSAFKIQVRKPSGTSDLLILSSKVIV